MIVSDRYEVLDLINEDNQIQTYRARHKALMTPFMFHRVRGSVAQKVMDQLSRLPDAQRELFTDADEDAIGPYLISRTLPDFDNLCAWMERYVPPSNNASDPVKGTATGESV